MDRVHVATVFNRLLVRLLHHTVVEKLLGFKFLGFGTGLGALFENEFELYLTQTDTLTNDE